MSKKHVVTEGLYDLGYDEIHLTASSKQRDATWFHESSHRLLSKTSLGGALEHDFEYLILKSDLSPMCKIRLESLRDTLIRQSFRTHEGCSVYSGLVGSLVVGDSSPEVFLSGHTEDYNRAVQPLLDLLPLNSKVGHSDLVMNEYIVSCIGRIALNFPEIVDIEKGFSSFPEFDEFIRRQNADQRLSMLLSRISSEVILELKETLLILTKQELALTRSEVSFGNLPEPGHEYYSRRNELAFNTFASVAPDIASRYLSLKERCLVLNHFYTRCSSIIDETGRQVLCIEHRENGHQPERFWYVGNQRLTRTELPQTRIIHVDLQLFQDTCRNSAGQEDSTTIVTIELLSAPGVKTDSHPVKYFLVHQAVNFSPKRIEYSGRIRSGPQELDHRGPIWSVRFARPGYFLWTISLADCKSFIFLPDYATWPYPKFIFSDSDREFVSFVQDHCQTFKMFLFSGRSDAQNEIMFVAVWIPEISTSICLLTAGIYFHSVVERLLRVGELHHYNPEQGVHSSREFLAGTWWWTQGLLGQETFVVED